jgi:hypothetical protein
MRGQAEPVQLAVAEIVADRALAQAQLAGNLGNGQQIRHPRHSRRTVASDTPQRAARLAMVWGRVISRIRAK